MPAEKSAFRKCLLGCLLSLVMQTVGAADPLRVVYFENYEPISWLDAETMRGALVEIVDEAITRRMGIAVEHRGFPWARAQEMVKKGYADAFLTVVTPERTEYTNTSMESVLSLDNVAYISARSPRRKELERIQTVEDLLPYALVDYFGNGWAKKRLAAHNVNWVPGMSNALRMVGAGRVDAFIEASQVVRYHVHKMNLDADIMDVATDFRVGEISALHRQKFALRRSTGSVRYGHPRHAQGRNVGPYLRQIFDRQAVIFLAKLVRSFS